MNLDSVIKFVTGNLRIRGNTDNTLIGNKSDRLKIDFEEMQKETYIVAATSIVIGNNKSMISLLNASGSTVIAKIREIFIYNSQTSPLTGVVSSFDMFRFTGHSDGTSLTPLPYDTNDSLNSSITARTGGTITGEAAAFLKRWQISSDEWGVGTSDVEGTDHSLSLWGSPIYVNGNPFLKPITLRANEGVHLKHTINSVRGTFDLYIVFTEE